MGKKKELCISDALEQFKSVITRAGLTDFIHENGIVVGKNPDNAKIVLVPDHELWVELMKQEEWKKQIKELTPTTAEERKIEKILNYIRGELLWIKMDEESLYKGTVIEISIKDYDYKVPVTKNQFPYKLRKSEFNEFYYQVSLEFVDPVLLLKKRFPMEIKETDYGFSLIRSFYII